MFAVGMELGIETTFPVQEATSSGLVVILRLSSLFDHLFSFFEAIYCLIVPAS